jgi:hypothetical protein
MRWTLATTETRAALAYYGIVTQRQFLNEIVSQRCLRLPRDIRSFATFAKP